MSSIEYFDLTEEQKEAQILALAATFVGLPGVVGAPLVMGADYYREVAIHMLECGARIIAAPIKSYQPPTDLRSAGLWVYEDPDTAPEDPRERYKRLAKEQNDEYLAAVEARRVAQAAEKKKRRR